MGRIKALAPTGPTGSVADVMRQDFQVVRDTETLDQVFEPMRAVGLRAVPVQREGEGIAPTGRHAQPCGIGLHEFTWDLPFIAAIAPLVAETGRFVTIIPGGLYLESSLVADPVNLTPLAPGEALPPRFCTDLAI